MSYFSYQMNKEVAGRIKSFFGFSSNSVKSSITLNFSKEFVSAPPAWGKLPEFVINQANCLLNEVSKCNESNREAALDFVRSNSFERIIKLLKDNGSDLGNLHQSVLIKTVYFIQTEDLARLSVVLEQ